jgi:LuxR family maltose regulon positive regulatory protein
MRDDGIAAAVEAPRRHIIERPRLTRLLDEADARILMLVAPAGYGKTTLARQWVESRGKTAIWITATPAFADPNRFAIRLRDALGPALGTAAPHLEDRLRSGPREWTEPEAIGAFLGGATEWGNTEPWLVIDDYHHAESEPAERFFDEFVRSSRARVLVASRRRPRWATARRLIYGEVHELGQSALAMNHDEATAVFAGRSSKHLAGLVALADGWPAILGLAASTAGPEVPGDSVRESVYDFFAEELYQAAPIDVRDALERFAIAPSLTAESAAVLEPGAPEFLQAGVRLGFLQFEQSSGTYVLHSLLRDFLVRRRNLSDADVDAAVERLASYYLESGLYDEVFALVKDTPQSGVARMAVDRALVQLLEEARVESLAPWLDHAEQLRLTTAPVDLAAAEIAFRNGKYKHAELLAVQSAERLPGDSPLKSRAWFRAGLSAYHENRSDAALKHHKAALEHAIRRDERLHAIWGLLTATLELERDAAPWIAELEVAAHDDPVTRVRLANARLGSGYRFGGIREALDDGEAVAPLLERVDDAMVTSAFLNSFAVCLVLAAEYERALHVVERELQIIDEFGLSFAIPHALASRIAANVGLRHFTAASRDVEQAERVAASSGDAFSVGNIAANRVKLLISQGDFERAADTADAARFAGNLPALRGELTSLRALALAAHGDTRKAEALAARAREETRSIEPTAYAGWADVLVGRHRDDERTTALAHDAFASALAGGCMHPAVCAYRASPEILHDLLTVDAFEAPIRALIWKAHDEPIGRAAGLDFPRSRTRDLSPRESEVLVLLGEGLSNRAIGQRLFISDVTAKAHVRKIFEKLGVRSRTEAALISASYLHDRDETL